MRARYNTRALIFLKKTRDAPRSEVRAGSCKNEEVIQTKYLMGNFTLKRWQYFGLFLSLGASTGVALRFGLENRQWRKAYPVLVYNMNRLEEYIIQDEFAAIINANYNNGDNNG